MTPLPPDVARKDFYFSTWQLLVLEGFIVFSVVHFSVWPLIFRGRLELMKVALSFRIACLHVLGADGCPSRENS